MNTQHAIDDMTRDDARARVEMHDAIRDAFRAIIDACVAIDDVTTKHDMRTQRIVNAIERIASIVDKHDDANDALRDIAQRAYDATKQRVVIRCDTSHNVTRATLRHRNGHDGVEVS